MKTKNITLLFVIGVISTFYGCSSPCNCQYQFDTAVAIYKAQTDSEKQANMEEREALFIENSKLKQDTSGFNK